MKLVAAAIKIAKGSYKNAVYVSTSYEKCNEIAKMFDADTDTAIHGFYTEERVFVRLDTALEIAREANQSINAATGEILDKEE